VFADLSEIGAGAAADCARYSRISLHKDLLPFATTKHAAKLLTLRYYKQGADMLTKSALAGLRLDEITDQQAQAFAAKNSAMSASSINRGLRTLRRACNLALHVWAD